MNNLTNREPESKKYSFKLLREEAVDIDLFEDKTHEKIADSLFKLINSEEKGISIGLEGPWGSGKSTVISIFKRKLKESNSSISLIRFDAWAHEGDPLRRIFLESLIDEIKSEVEVDAKLDDLKEEIAHRKKITKIKTTHTATTLGKWLSIAVFCVPIGVTFLSKFDYSLNTPTGTPYWLFSVGLFLSGAPLLVILGNLIRILLYKDLRGNIFDSKNWSFLQGKVDKDITQEVSEEDERSSVEFERYFNQIMELVFKLSKIRKVIIVVDDLDRIDKKDSLKIWSTLQTFLQQRNQTGNKMDWFDNIWMIVPYDTDGLSHIWDENSNDREKRGISKSFFDKCFQLRLGVPKPIFSGWEKFARDMIDHALEGWALNEKDELIRVLRITRKRIDDIPTPREIKNYINQVGFLASQWGTTIPISSIAYYVCWGELENKRVTDIKEKLVNNKLINSKHKALLSESCVKDLSGLVFGVVPEKGVQLLLEPEIASALQNADGEKLSELHQSHGEGFWSILNYHFEHYDMNLDYALTSAKAIYNSLWEDNAGRCAEFINSVAKIDLRVDPQEINWSEQNMDKYVCLLNLCHENLPFIRDIYDHLTDSLRISMDKDENVKWTEIIQFLSKVVNTIPNIDAFPSRKTINTLSLPKLILWAKASKATGAKAYMWVAPPESIIEEIKSAIVASTPLQEGLFEAIQYTIEAGIENEWDTILTQCQQYINWNNGNYSNQSDEIFKIINAVSFKSDKANQISNGIVKSGQYHNLLFHRRAQNLIYAALLCGYVFKKELHSIAIPTVQNSIAGFNEIKEFWLNSNIDNAKNIFGEIKQYNLWSFLWELADDEQNKVMKNIITLALDDGDALDLFRVEAGLAKLNNFSTLLENDSDEEEKTTKLVEKFIKHASLENEVLKTESLDIVEYSYPLYLLIKQTKKKEITTKIAEKLKEIDENTWADALEKNTYLTPLALAVKDKDCKFILETNFTYALIKFTSHLQGDIDHFTPWQKKHWSELISLMGHSFRTYYSGKVTDFLFGNMLTVSLGTFNLNKDYFIYTNIIGKTKVIQSAFEESIKSNDIERLELLRNLLSRDTKHTFKPENHFSDVIKSPLNELYSKQDDEGIRSLIKQLAEKFRINLSKNSEDTSDEDG